MKTKLFVVVVLSTLLIGCASPQKRAEREMEFHHQQNLKAMQYRAEEIKMANENGLPMPTNSLSAPVNFADGQQVQRSVVYTVAPPAYGYPPYSYGYGYPSPYYQYPYRYQGWARYGYGYPYYGGGAVYSGGAYYSGGGWFSGGSHFSHGGSHSGGGHFTHGGSYSGGGRSSNGGSYSHGTVYSGHR